jgi:hypothetical protein
VKIRESAGRIDSAQNALAYKISRFLLGSLHQPISALCRNRYLLTNARQNYLYLRAEFSRPTSFLRHSCNFLVIDALVSGEYIRAYLPGYCCEATPRMRP